MPPVNNGPTTDSPVRSFAPEQMVRCESCLRANPPTRVSCLYCGSGLQVQPSATVLQKPALRPLEKWEHGYNNILLPSSANSNKDCFAEIASLLRLESEDLQRRLAA